MRSDFVIFLCLIYLYCYVEGNSMCMEKWCVPAVKEGKCNVESVVNKMKDGNRDTVISEMVRLTVEQRKEVESKFLQTTKRTLISVSGGWFPQNNKAYEDAYNKLLVDPEYILAKNLLNAITNENFDDIVEIMFTFNDFGLQKIIDAYQKITGRSPFYDIQSIKSFEESIKTLLLNRIHTKRDENKPLDTDRALREVQEIEAFPEGGWEEAFLTSAVTDTYEQLNLFVNSFGKKQSKKTLKQIVAEYSTTYLREFYYPLVDIFGNMYGYLAAKLHKALTTGYTRDDNVLSRLIIARAEIDLISIETAYNALPAVLGKSSLKDDIHKNIYFSADYSKLLSEILSHDSS